SEELGRPVHVESPNQSNTAIRRHPVPLKFFAAAAAIATSRLLARPKPAGDKKSRGSSDKAERDNGLKFRCHRFKIAQTSATSLPEFLMR
ncbi:MAG: hypothetical protein WCO97_06440, partial [bacterium]